MSTSSGGKGIFTSPPPGTINTEIKNTTISPSSSFDAAMDTSRVTTQNEKSPASPFSLMSSASTPATFQLNSSRPPPPPPPLKASQIPPRNYSDNKQQQKTKFFTPPPSPILHELHKDVLDLKSTFKNTRSTMMMDILATNTRLTKSEELTNKQL